MTDTTTMTGAEFRRHAGTDPAKWAEAFDKEAGRLSAESGGHWPHNREERIAFLAQWFRDAMDAAVAEALGREWGRQYLGLDTDKLAADVKARREALGRLVPRQE